MSGTNEFLTFATGGGALVSPQATFSSAPWRDVGFSPGIADPAQLNKVWRQSSFVAAAVASYVIDRTPSVSVLDDGDLSGLVLKLHNAIQAQIDTRIIARRTPALTYFMGQI